MRGAIDQQTRASDHGWFVTCREFKGRSPLARNLFLSYSHRELPNDPDNPVPARVRAPLAAIRETRLARYPLFRADSIR